MNVAFAISVARPVTPPKLAVKADIPDRQLRANTRYRSPSHRRRYASDRCGCDNFSREQVWLLPARNREPRL